MLKLEDIKPNRLEWLTWALTRGYVAANTKGCLNWLRSKNDNGYGSLRVNSRCEFAHRVSYLIFNGPLSEGLCVCHSCDNPSCVNPKHLRLGIRKGRDSKRGHGGGFKLGHELSKGNRQRKLTDDQVKEIRATLGTGESLSTISERYGISLAHASMIRRGKRKALTN